MLIDIRYINAEISEVLFELARRQIEPALRPFETSVERAHICIEGVNGPHGGVDTRCSIAVQLVGSRRNVVVKSTCAEADDAVRAACSGLAERVSRALIRRRSPARVPTSSLASPAARRARSVSSREESRIQVTTADHERLQGLLDSGSSIRDRGAAERLADELDRAEVVQPEGIANTVVTMNSRVLFEDEQTGETRVVSLVYPQESDVAHGKISVLAPVGSALLGLTVGQKIDWPLPRGHVKRLRIVKVLYQPEDAGHFHL